MKTTLTWILSAFVAFVFVQSTFFKFSGAEQTLIIFSTIAGWFTSIGLPKVIATGFEHYGAYGVGAVELIAAAQILIPQRRRIGAMLSLAVLSGAIFFHLFTPLGIDRVIDQLGNTDGGALFFTAVALWLSSSAVLALTQRSPSPKADKLSSLAGAAAA